MVNSEHVNAVLSCVQPLNEQDMHHLQIFFETTPYCHAYLRFHLSIKDLEILDEFIFLKKKVFIYIHINPFELFGGVGGESPLQLFLSCTHFANTGPRRAVDKVFGYRCVSNFRSRGG